PVLEQAFNAHLITVGINGAHIGEQDDVVGIRHLFPDCLLQCLQALDKGRRKDVVGGDSGNHHFIATELLTQQVIGDDRWAVLAQVAFHGGIDAWWQGAGHECGEYHRQANHQPGEAGTQLTSVPESVFDSLAHVVESTVGWLLSVQPVPGSGCTANAGDTVPQSTSFRSVVYGPTLPCPPNFSVTIGCHAGCRSVCWLCVRSFSQPSQLS